MVGYVIQATGMADFEDGQWKGTSLRSLQNFRVQNVSQINATISGKD